MYCCLAFARFLPCFGFFFCFLFCFCSSCFFLCACVLAWCFRSSLFMLAFVVCCLLVSWCVNATGHCIRYGFLGLYSPPSSLSFLSLPSFLCFFLLLSRFRHRSLSLSALCDFLFLFSVSCLLCCVLMSWGGVLAGWLCCVGAVYVFSLCLMPHRRKVPPPM